MAEEQKDGLMSEEVGKSVTAIPLDIDPERYKAMELRLQEVIPEGAYELYMKSDSDISEEYADVREEDPEAFDAVLRVNTDVNRQAMDRSQFSTDEAVAGSPIPEIDTYLMENSVYLNTIPPGFERKKELDPQATAHVIPESPIVDRTQRGQLPGLSADVEQQDRVRLHETVHGSGVMGEYDSLTTRLLAKTIGDESSAEAATTGLDLYRAISRDDPIAARQSINYLLKQKVNLYLYRDELIDNMMRAIDVLEETSDGGIELTPERKIEIRKDIKKEFKNIPRILENMRLERAGEKEPPKMDEGGLMADPLVLSETAEEEAEPKISIGEYAEGIKEFGEDLSPAGTAEAIINTGKALMEGEYGEAAISALGALPGGKTATKAAKALDVGVDEAKLAGEELRNYASATVKMLEDTAKKTGKVAGDKGEKLYAPVEEGTKVAVRKNLNSSVGEGVDKSLNTLQTLHAGTYSGKALSYMPVVTVKNAEFAIGQAGRRDIAAKILGKETKASKNKFPMASVNGEYTNSPSVLEQYTPENLVEIGFNPKFNHLFIDMKTGQAVKGADEATIIGDRVYAKGVKYWKKSEAPEPLPTSKGEELPSDVRYREMNAGGLMSDEYNRAES